MAEDLLVEITTEEIVSVQLETTDTVAVSVEDTVTASETIVDVISTESSVVNITSVAAQGPAGPIGPQGNTGPIGPQGPIGPEGISGIQSIVIFTNIPLSGNKVIAYTANGVAYADNTNLTHIGSVLGFTRTSCSANSNTSIQTFGFLNGFYGLNSGLPVYLSTNGDLTQTVPTTGFVNNLGIAISSTELNINITMPIVKE
jgi:hypothetical protein